jgi:hypothetical protein
VKALDVEFRRRPPYVILRHNRSGQTLLPARVSVEPEAVVIESLTPIRLRCAKSLGRGEFYALPTIYRYSVPRKSINVVEVE